MIAIPVETTLETRYTEFQRELEMLINKLGLEAGSNTPDFVLDEYEEHIIAKVKEAWNTKADTGYKRLGEVRY